MRFQAFRGRNRSARPKREKPESFEFTSFNRKALRNADAPSFEEQLEEGIMLGKSAARMTLKNRILIRALREDKPFNTKTLRGEAAKALQEISTEADADAALASEELTRAAGRDGDAVHQHDYRDADVPNLERRERLSRGIAEAFKAASQNEETIQELVQSAQKEGYQEVKHAIESRPPVTAPKSKAELEAHEQRMRELRDELAVELEEQGIRPS